MFYTCEIKTPAKTIDSSQSVEMLWFGLMTIDAAERTVAEYFAGIGLVRMGLEPSGWKVVFANDNSSKKLEMYREFFPDADEHYSTKDVFELEVDDVPQSTLATCSFPCVDLSLAGNMNGMSGKQSSAFWGFTRILEAQGEFRPQLVLLENVPGWLHSNKGTDFRLTIKALNQLGYACDVFTLDALRFTPQSRPRIFVVGVRSFVTPNYVSFIRSRAQSLLSDQLNRRILENHDLRWYYINIPEPPPFLKRGLSTIIEQMEEDDERWWSDEQVLRHIGMMNDTHRERLQQLEESHQTAYRTFFRRIRNRQQRVEARNDELAGCLRTAVGGSGKQFLIRVKQGNVRMRTLTEREYARLQGVPDSYRIGTKGVQALTGFGDAVCVPAINWIAENILNPMTEKLEVFRQTDVVTISDV